MKEYKNTKKITDRDWKDLASALSEEKNDNSDLANKFLSEDSYRTDKQWKELSKMNDDKKIDVDKAWTNVYSRLQEEGTLPAKMPSGIIFMRSTFLKIAAVALMLISIGSIFYFAGKSGLLSREIIAATNNEQKNFLITLPDNSKIFLNRNTKLAYRSNFGKPRRSVTLWGEAFFEIAKDSTKPFIIDAGKASVKVIGTSFNVLTKNRDSAVEVFVKTGKVMLYDNSGIQNVVLEPGYIGTIDSGATAKTINNDPNYMAWNTGHLIYDGQKLDIVFKDLKKVYDMNIIADDPEILNETWTSPIDNQPQDTIIRLICASFNLSYTREGNIYHLAKK
jgi:transmembrane sensor